MDALVTKVREAFADCPRPEHFTNFWHCDECREHDETLQAHTPDTISLEQLGNPGWDPICFIVPEGFAYYVPGLVRLASENPRLYLDQFLFHLNYNRIPLLSAVQRAAVLEWLLAMDAAYAALADDSPSAYQMRTAVEQLRGP